MTHTVTKSLKVKGPDIYIPPLTGKPLPNLNSKWRTDQHYL